MGTTVGDVMTTRVVAVRRSAQFKQIARVLREYRVSACPVINDAGRVVGVVSEADLLHKTAAADLPAGLIRLRWKLGEASKVTAVTAQRLMTSPAVTIRPDASVQLAARIMRDRGVKRLPVTGPDGELVGIVSRVDLLAVYDRADADMLAEVQQVLSGEFGLSPDDCEASVCAGVITLAGTIRLQETALEVAARLGHVEGVVAVRDRLQVSQPDGEPGAAPEQGGEPGRRRKLGRRAGIGRRRGGKEQHGGQDMSAKPEAGGNGGAAVTDLGRRIREQRESAGIGLDDAAQRAGVAAGYLSYLESSPDASPSQATVTRLAAALGTTVGALSGTGMNLPPGKRSAAARPVLQPLSAQECRDRIAPGGIGRVVFDQEGRGPVAVPVNYKMDGDDVVFRTEPGGPLAAGVSHGSVSFDVDHIDDALAEGWSVLLTGTASVITDAGERQRADALGIEPWAGGDRPAYVRLRAREVTGRGIRARG